MIDEEAVMRLGRQLERFQKGGPGSPENNSPLHQLFAICENEPETRAVLRKHGANRQTLKRAYRTLRLNGGGQIVKGHYVACSSLALPGLLDHFLSSQDRPPVEVVLELIGRIEKREFGETPGRQADSEGPPRPSAHGPESVEGLTAGLAELALNLSGKRFGELVLYHYRKQTLAETVAATQGTIELLPLAARDAVEGWIDYIGAMATVERFWQDDAGDALLEITGHAVPMLSDLDVASTDDNLFNLFQIIVLSMAYTAHTNREWRMFIQKAIGHGLLRRTLNF